MIEFTGQFVRLEKAYETNKWQIVLSINEERLLEALSALNGVDKLQVQVKKYHAKRSLDANAYLWVLMSEMAKVLGTSKEEVYEEMLQRYGVLYKDEQGYVTITVPARTDVSKFGHFKFYRQEGKFKAYLAIKGTSEYDSKEMASFLDSVIYEALSMGIQTETPEEVERMKNLWQGKNNTR